MKKVKKLGIHNLDSSNKEQVNFKLVHLNLPGIQDALGITEGLGESGDQFIIRRIFPREPT